MAIGKLKRYKSPGTGQIQKEMIKTGKRTKCSQIYKPIYSVWNKEEMPQQWKESIIVPIYKKGDKTDCSNYRGISLVSTAQRILSNILLSRSTPHAHQYGFQCNRSTTDHIFCIQQILEKIWEYNEAVLQKSCESVSGEVLCNILTDFGITMKQ
jgi:hypothetical protein